MPPGEIFGVCLFEQDASGCWNEVDCFRRLYTIQGHHVVFTEEADAFRKRCRAGMEEYLPRTTRPLCLRKPSQSHDDDGSRYVAYVGDPCNEILTGGVRPCHTTGYRFSSTAERKERML